MVKKKTVKRGKDGTEGRKKQHGPINPGRKIKIKKGQIDL